MVTIGMDKLGWYCIKDLNHTLVGQYASIERAMLKIGVNPCVNSTNMTANMTEDDVCASPELITDFINKA
jgi:hypothetical protein